MCRLIGMNASTTGRQLTASIGVRLSKQAKGSNLSLPGMLGDCEALADRLGARVIERHIDDGTSGSVREREKLLAWLDDGSSGRADILITPTTDRVTRDGVWTAARVLDVVEGRTPGQPRPVRLVTVDGLDSDNKASFRLAFVIQAELARAELERITDRNTRTRARLNEAGRWAGGPIPYGCRVREDVTEEDGRRKVAKYLEADPAEAAILQDVAGKLLAGQATHSVARWLVSQGIKTRRGNDWSVRTLKVALSNQAAQAHVFDASTWRALQKRLEPKGNAGGGAGRPQVWLLARGNGVCGTCGKNLTTSRKNYVCENLACPAQIGIKAGPVDEYLEREILDAFGDVRWPVVVTSVEGVEELEAARQAEEEAQAALLAELTPENLAALQSARATLAELESRPATTTQRVELSKNTFGEDWAAADVPERARMLRWAIRRPVKIHPQPAGAASRMVHVETRVEYERSLGDGEWPN
jgi:site-specific DNA recombinase